MPLPNKLRRPILCYVTDRRSLAKAAEGGACHALLHVIEAAAAAGIDWIQIREKDLSAREHSWLTHEALCRTARSQGDRGIAPRIIVNERLSVALSEGASGVHLGVGSLPLKEIRSSLAGHELHHSGKPPILIGSSCHSQQATALAAADGADYIIFGPIFATPSKAMYGPPQGLDRLAEVCASVSIPVLAIGGITLENAASCLAHGASGLAAIRLFQDASDLKTVVERLHNLPG
jgi:thiamine-phosphate pyrophosphorylase